MTFIVSVIMTVYNAQDYLPDAIKSILNQSFKDYEFIIVDDCSTDNSLRISRAFEKQDKRIRIICHSQNMGIAYSRNTGLKNAKGKYIAWMDADDVSSPDRIEKEYTFLENNSNVGVIGSNAVLIDSKGNCHNEIFMPQTHQTIAWALCFYDPIINPSVMVKRDLYNKVGDYRNLAENNEGVFPEDYDLWMRLVHKTQFHNLPDPLLYLRKHDHNITNKINQATIQNSIRVCGWYLNSLHIPNIDESDAELLWNLQSTSNSLKKLKTLNRLAYFFITDEETTDKERIYIKRDFVVRLKQLLDKKPCTLITFFTYCLLRGIQIELRIRKIFEKN